ncbi:hypothetical protein B0H14DRAFT_2617233 [Mycena olivaceomarginata]|nr:hypothetical protein B0H14DRAFT_2617233 [Mycena olivaceomarginata]
MAESWESVVEIARLRPDSPTADSTWPTLSEGGPSLETPEAEDTTVRVRELYPEIAQVQDLETTISVQVTKPVEISAYRLGDPSHVDTSALPRSRVIPSLLGGGRAGTAPLSRGTPFKSGVGLLVGLATGAPAMKAPAGKEAKPNILKRLGVGPMSRVGNRFIEEVGSPEAHTTSPNLYGKSKAPALQPRPSNPFETLFATSNPTTTSTPASNQGQPSAARAPIEADQWPQIEEDRKELLQVGEEEDLSRLPLMEEEGGDELSHLVAPIKISCLDLQEEVRPVVAALREEEVEEALPLEEGEIRGYLGRWGRLVRQDRREILVHQDLWEEEEQLERGSGYLL